MVVLAGIYGNKFLKSQVFITENPLSSSEVDMGYIFIWVTRRLVMALYIDSLYGIDSLIIIQIWSEKNSNCKQSLD